MTYKFRTATETGFKYGEHVLHHVHFRDLCIGTYNGMELYNNDILKINNMCFLIYTQLSNPKLRLRCLKFNINRNPRSSYGVNIVYNRTVTDLLEIPDEFELVGNIYDQNNLKI